MTHMPDPTPLPQRQEPWYRFFSPTVVLILVLSPVFLGLLCLSAAFELAQRTWNKRAG